MALKPGTVDDFTDSMAEAMEDAFRVVWEDLKGTALPEAGETDRRMLFVSIAQGVVRHLRERAEESFSISVDTEQVTGSDGPLIRSDNPNSISVSSGWTLSAGEVDVEQLEASDNKVRSLGTATVDEILYDGELYG